MYGSLITAEQLHTHFYHADWLVFDCRFNLADPEQGRRQYDESHIPGAVYAHLDQDLSSPITAQSGRHPLPESKAFCQWLSACGFDRHCQVVVYDDSGGAMASRLWWLLKCLGHEAVALLDGGWQAWLAAGYGVSHQHPARTPGHFDAEFDSGFWVSTDDIINNLEDPVFQLVDVRAAERYRGISEPIDPVAGHIPGAINIPLTENLDAQGKFKSVDELQALYAEVNQQYPADRQVYMCGSGVTACHSVLAQVVAGLALPRVYTGSWSEWIRDASRPVATDQSN